MSGDTIDLDVSGELYWDMEEELMMFDVSTIYFASHGGDAVAILGSLSDILNNLFAGHLSCSVNYH